MSKASTDVDNVLLNPEHKSIVQAILKYEIQGLLKKLSQSGVETVVLTAGTEEGQEHCWYFGSEKGTDFVSHVKLDWVRKEFINFCANSGQKAGRIRTSCITPQSAATHFTSLVKSGKKRGQKAGRIRTSCIAPQSGTSHCNADVGVHNRGTSHCNADVGVHNRGTSHCNADVDMHDRGLAIDFETPANALIRYDMPEGDLIMSRDKLLESHLKPNHSVPTFGCTSFPDSERNICVNVESLDEVGKPKAVEDEIPYNHLDLDKIEDQNDLKIFHYHDLVMDREVQANTRFSKAMNQLDHNIDISTRTQSCDTQYSHRNDSLPMDKNDTIFDITKIGDCSIKNGETSQKIKSEPEYFDLEPEPETVQSCFSPVNDEQTISGDKSCDNMGGQSTINNLEELVNVHMAVSTESDGVQTMLQIPWLSRKGPVHDVSHSPSSRRMSRKNLGIPGNSVHSDDLLCSECGKTFNQAGSMLRHKMRKHFPGSFECSVCARKFAYRSDLDKHFRTHSGEKPYPCSVCGKAFADSGNKRKHEARCKIRTKKTSYFLS